MISGPRKKPAHCLTCPLHGTSFGFVGDKFPKNTKVAVLKYQPVTAEIQSQQNCPEEKGEFWRKLIKPSGLDLSEVGFANIIRCKHPPEKINKDLYMRTSLACRQYDSKHANIEGRLRDDGLTLNKFNPNAYIITYDIYAILTAVAHKIFIRRAFEIAAWYASLNYRPLVLMGPEAARLVNPELFNHTENYVREVTFKPWVGHHFILSDWPYKPAAENSSFVNT